MAAPASTQKRVTCALQNGCGLDFPATLNYSNYHGAPGKINSNTLPTQFAQNMEVGGLYGGLVYDVGMVKWIILWTTDIKVATKILKSKDSIIWEDIVSILQPNESFDNGNGDAFSAEARIYANGDGSLNLKAQIKWSGCK